MAASGFSQGTVKNFKAAADRINRYARMMDGALGPNLRRIGEEIMTDVKASAPGRGVPRDQGTLAGTGRVEGPKGSLHAPEVELSFGGASALYALIQHERTDYHHKVGESRYLVRGMERWKPGGSSAMTALQNNAKAGVKSSGG